MADQRDEQKTAVCTMCGRSRDSAPGPLVWWPQLDAWICGDRMCRREAEFAAHPERFKPVNAKVAAVPDRAN